MPGPRARRRRGPSEPVPPRRPRARAAPRRPPRRAAPRARAGPPAAPDGHGPSRRAAQRRAAGVAGRSGPSRGASPRPFEDDGRRRPGSHQQRERRSRAGQPRVTPGAQNADRARLPVRAPPPGSPSGLAPRSPSAGGKPLHGVASGWLDLGQRRGRRLQEEPGERVAQRAHRPADASAWATARRRAAAPAAPDERQPGSTGRGRGPRDRTGSSPERRRARPARDRRPRAAPALRLRRRDRRTPTPRLPSAAA